MLWKIMGRLYVNNKRLAKFEKRQKETEKSEAKTEKASAQNRSEANKARGWWLIWQDEATRHDSTRDTTRCDGYRRYIEAIYGIVYGWAEKEVAHILWAGRGAWGRGKLPMLQAPQVTRTNEGK